jgi:hypothetical protein
MLRAQPMLKPVEGRARRRPPCRRELMMFWPPTLKLVPRTPMLLLFWLPMAVLPLHAELGRLVGVDFDDQAFDQHLRAAAVELVDHGAQLPVLRLGRRDDQRVGGRVGLDLAAGGRLAGWRCERRGGRGAGAVLPLRWCCRSGPPSADWWRCPACRPRRSCRRCRAGVRSTARRAAWWRAAPHRRS